MYPRHSWQRLSQRGVLLLLLWAHAPVLHGQVVRGVVTDLDSNAVIAGVEVSLSDSTGVVAQTVTDSAGKYVLRPPRPGLFIIRVAVLGYAEVSSPLWISADEEVPADVQLKVEPIPLDQIQVTAEGRMKRLQTVGFYHRLEQGYGHFIIRDQIERRSANQVTDLLHGLPGVRVAPTSNGQLSEVIMRGGASTGFEGLPSLRRGSGQERTQFCLPSITIDGTVVRRGGRGIRGEEGRWNELVHPSEIEAIEVFVSAAGLPVEVSGTTSPCGAVLIWTRR